MSYVVPDIPAGRQYREYRFSFNDTNRLPEVSTSRQVTVLWLAIYLSDALPLAVGTTIQTDNAYILPTDCQNINFAWNTPLEGMDFVACVLHA